MTIAQLEHPPGPVLVAYGLGERGEFDVAELDSHLAECAECRQEGCNRLAKIAG